MKEESIEDKIAEEYFSFLRFKVIAEKYYLDYSSILSATSSNKLVCKDIYGLYAYFK